jgi:hypothetical protein
VHVQTANTQDGSLLRSIRTTLDEADEALLAVAFVSDAGVHLLRKQLARLGDRTRLLVTTTFGTTTPTALAMARDLGVDVRTLSPGTGTYHPKAFLTRRAGGEACSVVGSSNITGGLVVNVEVATTLRGHITDPPLAEAWRWAESAWQRPETRRWQGADVVVSAPTFDGLLLTELQRQVEDNPLFLTLSHARPNRVTEVNESGLYVETEASQAKGRPPQLVPAWMFELAYQALRSRGRLTQQSVLNELNIKRSAAVCAILARLEHVSISKDGRSTELLWRADP